MRSSRLLRANAVFLMFMGSAAAIAGITAAQRSRPVAATVALQKS